MIELILAALIAIMPYIPQPMRGCIERTQQGIIARSQIAFIQHGVPPAMLVTVAFLESHLGCARGSGGCWGAPIDPLHRKSAGTSNHAARALATSFRVCHTWLGAISRFRCGNCVCRRLNGYTAPYAISQVELVNAQAGLPEIEHLRQR